MVPSQWLYALVAGCFNVLILSSVLLTVSPFSSLMPTCSSYQVVHRNKCYGKQSITLEWMDIVGTELPIHSDSRTDLPNCLLPLRSLMGTAKEQIILGWRLLLTLGNDCFGRGPRIEWPPYIWIFLYNL